MKKYIDFLKLCFRDPKAAKKILKDKKRNFIISVRNLNNKIWAKQRRKKLKRQDFTVISNNCWGASVYRYFGLPYMSPTVGTYFFAEEYVKFCKNLSYYLGQKLKFIPYEQSKYKKYLEERNHTHCPIGVLQDVEIVFLHFHSEEEAAEKWNKRAKRVVWDNLFLKNSEQNVCTDKELKEFSVLPERKVLFTAKRRGLPAEILWKEAKKKKEVSDDITHFKKYIDLVQFLNGEEKFEK